MFRLSYNNWLILVTESLYLDWEKRGEKNFSAQGKDVGFLIIFLVPLSGVFFKHSFLNSIFLSDNSVSHRVQIEFDSTFFLTPLIINESVFYDFV